MNINEKNKHYLEIMVAATALSVVASAALLCFMKYGPKSCTAQEMRVGVITLGTVAGSSWLLAVAMGSLILRKHKEEDTTKRKPLQNETINSTIQLSPKTEPHEPTTQGPQAQEPQAQEPRVQKPQPQEPRVQEPQAQELPVEQQTPHLMAQTKHPTPPTHSQHPITLKAIQEQIIPPIMNSLRNYLIAYLRLHGGAPKGYEEKIKTAIDHLQIVLDDILTNPKVAILDLLTELAIGSTPHNEALMQAVAAYHLGDQGCFNEAHQREQKIKNCRDIPKLQNWVKGKNEQEIINKLPNFLLKKSSIVDPNFKKLAGVILSETFSKEGLDKIQQLQAFKEKPNLETLKGLVVGAFEHADHSNDQQQRWHKEIEAFVIHIAKEPLLKLADILANNMEILVTAIKPLPSDRDRQALGKQLDLIYWKAITSNGGVNPTHQQALQRQYEINKKRKAHSRILALKYSSSMDLCPYIDQKAQSDSEGYYSIPCRLEDHPLKKNILLVKRWENAISWGKGTVIKAFEIFFKGYAKNKALEGLPIHTPEAKAAFEKAFNILISLMINPALDSILGQSEFKTRFKKMVDATSPVIIPKLRKLAATQEPSFEQIGGTLSEVLDDIASEMGKYST